MLASPYYSSTFPSLLLRFTFFLETKTWCGKNVIGNFPNMFNACFVFLGVHFFNIQESMPLRVPLSYKEHLWLVGIFYNTRPVVAWDGVYIEWMELCIGYYRGVSDVHLDIRHTSNDDRHCSKNRNNQILRHIKIWPYKYCFILHSLYSFKKKIGFFNNY